MNEDAAVERDHVLPTWSQQESIQIYSFEYSSFFFSVPLSIRDREIKVCPWMLFLLYCYGPYS